MALRVSTFGRSLLEAATASAKHGRRSQTEYNGEILCEINIKRANKRINYCLGTKKRV